MMPTMMRSPLLLPLLALLLLALPQNAQGGEPYKIAIVPKMTSAFFDQANQGCIDRVSSEPDVTCVYAGTPEADVEGSIAIINDLIDDPSVRAIAISVLDPEAYEPAINRGMELGKPIVTFDSDSPNSNRLAYVGTDNYAMGKELAKLLKQIKPDGGRYGILSGIGLNLQQRVEGVRSVLQEEEQQQQQRQTRRRQKRADDGGGGSGSAWVEVELSPKNGQEDPDVCLQEMWTLVRENPDLGAIVSVVGLPMYKENRTDWKNFVDSNRNVLTVVADTLPIQLDLMQASYVDALVGQLPYNMGLQSADTLLTALDMVERGAALSKNTLPSDIISGTHQLEVLRIPLQLPPLDFNYNYIGNIAIVGYVLCALITSGSVGFVVWTRCNRKHQVVVSGQPVFLIMICVGTFLMGSAIIPLGIDDETSQRAADISCMSVPWLLNIGFTVTFSALFSKTWRLNKLFNSGHNLRRIQVTEKDVILPFVALLSIIIITLICWTVIAPLKFVRTNELGTDPWNRPIGSYGQCMTDNGAPGGSLPYNVVIAVVILTALIVANLQAYRSRNIQTEFSESSYIAMANASFLQAIVVCVPILFLTKENPQAYYLIWSVVIFIVSGAILVFIFVPKILALKEAPKRRTLGASVRVSGLRGLGSGLSKELSHVNLSRSRCLTGSTSVHFDTSTEEGGGANNKTQNNDVEDPVQNHLQQFQALSFADRKAVLQKLEVVHCASPSKTSSEECNIPSTMVTADPSSDVEETEEDPAAVERDAECEEAAGAKNDNTIEGVTTDDDDGNATAAAEGGSKRNSLVSRVLAARAIRNKEAVSETTAVDTDQDVSELLAKDCNPKNPSLETASQEESDAGDTTGSVEIDGFVTRGTTTSVYFM